MQWVNGLQVVNPVESLPTWFREGHLLVAAQRGLAALSHLGVGSEHDTLGITTERFGGSGQLCCAHPSMTI